MTPYEVAAATTSASPLMVDEFLRGRADAHKPRFVELRCDGVTPDAIQTIFGARDVIAKCQRKVVTVMVDGQPVEKEEPDDAWHARVGWEVMEYLRLQDKFFPVSADEVPPMARPPFVERSVDVVGEWDALAARSLAAWESREIEASEERENRRFAQHIWGNGLGAAVARDGAS